MQGLVEDEIGENYAQVKEMAQLGKIQLISGDDVLASEVSVIAVRYNIGLGESECIAIGKKFSYDVASDDRKARLAVCSELGSNRIIGSLGLLKMAVQEGLLTPAAAFDVYKAMVSAGGFLPRIKPDYFQ